MGRADRRLAYVFSGGGEDGIYDCGDDRRDGRSPIPKGSRASEGMMCISITGVSRIRATTKSAKVLCCAADHGNDRRAGQVSLVGFSVSRRNGLITTSAISLGRIAMSIKAAGSPDDKQLFPFLPRHESWSRNPACPAYRCPHDNADTETVPCQLP